MIIILDTNFIVYCAKYNLFFNLEENYPNAKYIVLDNVIFELEKIRDKKFRVTKEDIVAANIGLEYLDLKKKKNMVEIIKTAEDEKKDVDSLVLILAKKYKEKDKNLFVATMDDKLAKNLKQEKIKLLKIRQKKYIMEG